MLVKLDMAPNSVTGGGRGKERLFNADGLSQFALAAALFWSGIEVVSAGRFAKAIFESFYEIYGRSPLSRLYEHARNWAGEVVRLQLHPDFVALKNSERTDDAIIYAAMRNVGDYKPGEEWRDDVYFELIDRQYGFVGPPKGLATLHPLSGRRAKMSPHYRVAGWSRGGDLQITKIEDEFPVGWHEHFRKPDSPAVIQAREIENEFFAAYDNPRGKLAVNISHAIRSGHDRIYDLRQKRAGEGGAHA
ncbi:MAG: hypothetical protein FJX06_18585 [Alphaproteobacteria bacterium]|nr:hypothetical protein [Alphaproteobacteria bacterium]